MFVLFIACISKSSIYPAFDVMWPYQSANQTPASVGVSDAMNRQPCSADKISYSIKIQYLYWLPIISAAEITVMKFIGLAQKGYIGSFGSNSTEKTILIDRLGKCKEPDHIWSMHMNNYLLHCRLFIISAELIEMIQYIYAIQMSSNQWQLSYWNKNLIII